MAYTKPELEGLKNTLLASGQPIPASQHRTFEQALIDELFDAQSRGDLLADVNSSVSNQSDDLYFVIRGGVAYLVPSPVSAFDRVITSTVGNIVLNMASKVERVFVGSASFTVNKSVSFSNAGSAIRATLFVVLTGGCNLTFPANIRKNANAGGWAANVWTGDAGAYKIDMMYDGTNWHVDISGPRDNA